MAVSGWDKRRNEAGNAWAKTLFEKGIDCGIPSNGAFTQAKCYQALRNRWKNCLKEDRQAAGKTTKGLRADDIHKFTAGAKTQHDEVADRTGSLLEEDTDCHSQDMDETQRDDTASEEAHLADRQAQVRENLDLTEGAKHVPKDLEVHLNCSWPEPHTSYSTVAWGAIVSDTELSQHVVSVQLVGVDKTLELNMGLSSKTACTKGYLFEEAYWGLPVPKDLRGLLSRLGSVVEWPMQAMTTYNLALPAKSYRKCLDTLAIVAAEAQHSDDEVMAEAERYAAEEMKRRKDFAAAKAASHDQSSGKGSNKGKRSGGHVGKENAGPCEVQEQAATDGGTKKMAR
ncbi:hypothetical protein ABBQ38_009865 [Trebouxia sp. C0009 RCD-2024]